MNRVLEAAALMIAACLIAGTYGAVHNQISYAVSPDYFHAFKFHQFSIDDALRNRLGASLVGWSASWWTGMILTPPIYVACLIVRKRTPLAQTFLSAAVAIVGVAIVSGLLALVSSFFLINPGALPAYRYPEEVSDKAAFARAGTMHNFSYLGALLGLVAGIVVIWRKATARPAGA